MMKNTNEGAFSLEHLAKRPDIHPSVYVDPTARINGDVIIGEDASVWFHVSIRGDVHRIRIGAGTNIQDQCALHTTTDRFPLDIGPRVVVGHGAILHGCTVHGPALIGMRALLMDGCVIEPDVVVGAGAVVTEGRVMPAGHLVLGMPARPIRKLEEDELRELRQAWTHYRDYVAEYRRQGKFHGWKDNLLWDT
jgi:carbonic anhydrase/acetyltransferase-like protein (isoleucine patch superfamily)